MNEENTKKIFENFPEFFKHRNDYKVSLMNFGFEHDNGWFNLVYQLCEDIKAELQKTPCDHFEVEQVKEKFGGLRFYVSAAPEKIHQMIDKAERDSYKICEICGKPAELSLQNGYYYRTLCAKHRKIKNAEILKDSSEDDPKTFHVSLRK